MMNDTLKGMNNIFIVNMSFMAPGMSFIQYCRIAGIFMLILSQEVRIMEI